MSYYAIGIGGTGAKCLESLIHLATAGMMPDEDQLYVLFVDPDGANGSLDRAQQTLTRYVACKDTLELGKTSLLKTKIYSAEPNLWTPLEALPAPSLGKFFLFDGLDPSTQHLFEVLYSKKERETPLAQGFRGHPSIGSAVMAKTVDLGVKDPWATFKDQLAIDPDPKIFLAGSIFGGTGASGFPTIARLVKNELENIGKADVKLGGALVLPYFHFIFPPDDKEAKAEDEDDKELKAKAEDFLVNTQAALKYYYLWNQTGIYDAVYLFGDESQTEVKPCLGGKDQRNTPHFIELYAALAAIHFFGFKFDAKADPQYFLTARNKGNELQWSDLPDGNGGNTIRLQIGQLARFAFAYLSVYQPMLEDIYNKGKGYRAPWFVGFFERNQIPIKNAKTQEPLKDVGNYCHTFLRWLADIQTNCGTKETIELVNYSAYAEKDAPEIKSVDNFVLKDFSNLILPKKKEDPKALNKLWERMSDGRDEALLAADIGKFFSALYQNCAE